MSRPSQVLLSAVTFVALSACAVATNTTSHPVEGSDANSSDGRAPADGSPNVPRADANDTQSPVDARTPTIDADTECRDGTEPVGNQCVDIDGCADTPCYPGVQCTDVPAPGTGFTCGECPDGMSGNGQNCYAECAASASLTVGSTVQDSTSGPNGADNVDEWACAPHVDSRGPEVIYTFVAQQSGTVTAKVSNISDDVDIFVMRGACDSSDASACIAFSAGLGDKDEEVTWSAQAGTTYYIIIDSVMGETSIYELNLRRE